MTVVVPCYNYGRFLRSCVASVLDQTDVSVDVVIIDDASRDDSYEIARSLAEADSRVRVVRHEVNQGHIATYNEGLELATGEFFALLSADDMLTSGALARSVALMQHHPSVGLVYGCLILLRDDVPPPARTTGSTWAVWKGTDWAADVCKVGINAISPQAVLRTATVRSAGGFRRDFPHSADLLLWLEASALGDVGLLVGVDQAYYRQHGQNMSQTTYVGWARDMQERVRTFDTFLAEPPTALEHAAQMREDVHAALGKEALRHADEALLAGDDESAQALRGLAASIGHSETRRAVRLSRGRLTGVAVRSARHAVQTARYKRLRLVGVY